MVSDPSKPDPIRHATPEEIEAQRQGALNYQRSPGDRRNMTQEEYYKARKISGEHMDLQESVYVVTHVNSQGTIESQFAILDEASVDVFMRKTFPDFSAADYKPLVGNHKRIYTCCLDHVVVARLQVK